MGIASILNFSTPRYRVRVWRAVPYEPTGFTELEVLAVRLQDNLSLQELAEELCKQPDVMMVEVLDWNNNGVHCFNE